MMWHLGRRELAFKQNLDVMHAYQKKWMHIQSEGEMGNWGVEAKMRKTNEVFWFHKGNMYSLVSSYNYSN
jgi:hypothetical protein